MSFVYLYTKSIHFHVYYCLNVNSQNDQIAVGLIACERRRNSGGEKGSPEIRLRLQGIGLMAQH